MTLATARPAPVSDRPPAALQLLQQTLALAPQAGAQASVDQARLALHALGATVEGRFSEGWSAVMAETLLAHGMTPWHPHAPWASELLHAAIAHRVWGMVDVWLQASPTVEAWQGLDFSPWLTSQQPCRTLDQALFHAQAPLWLLQRMAERGHRLGWDEPDATGTVLADRARTLEQVQLLTAHGTLPSLAPLRHIHGATTNAVLVDAVLRHWRQRPEAAWQAAWDTYTQEALRQAQVVGKHSDPLARFAPLITLNQVSWHQRAPMHTAQGQAWVPARAQTILARRLKQQLEGDWYVGYFEPMARTVDPGLPDAVWPFWAHLVARQRLDPQAWILETSTRPLDEGATQGRRVFSSTLHAEGRDAAFARQVTQWSAEQPAAFWQGVMRTLEHPVMHQGLDDGARLRRRMDQWQALEPWVARMPEAEQAQWHRLGHDYGQALEDWAAGAATVPQQVQRFQTLMQHSRSLRKLWALDGHRAYRTARDRQPLDAATLGQHAQTLAKAPMLFNSVMPALMWGAEQGVWPQLEESRPLWEGLMAAQAWSAPQRAQLEAWRLSWVLADTPDPASPRRRPRL